MPDAATTLAYARAHLRNLSEEVAELQDVRAAEPERRWKDVRDSLVLAALYEIPRVLDSLDRLSYDTIEQLEADLANGVTYGKP